MGKLKNYRASGGAAPKKVAKKKVAKKKAVKKQE